MVLAGTLKIDGQDGVARVPAKISSALVEKVERWCKRSRRLKISAGVSSPMMEKQHRWIGSRLEEGSSSMNSIWSSGGETSARGRRSSGRRRR